MLEVWGNEVLAVRENGVLKVWGNGVLEVRGNGRVGMRCIPVQLSCVLTGPLVTSPPVQRLFSATLEEMTLLPAICTVHVQH